jgi:hypothetical protein
MTRIEETWKVFVNIATLGFYGNDFTFFKKSKKKSIETFSSPDAINLRTRGSVRRNEVSLRCPE